MNKEEMFKVIGGATVLVVVLSSFGVENEVVATIAAILSAGLILTAIALGAERGTELLKIVMRAAFGNVTFLKWLQPSGAGSVLLAAVVAFAGVQKFSPDIFSGFAVFASVDPQLVELITSAAVWLGASLVHGQLPDGLKAQKVK